MAGSRTRKPAAAGKGRGIRRPSEARIPGFGPERIFRELARMGQGPGGVAVMDRRVVLKALALRLEVEEEVLLRRGFDRAYRQIVEGV